MNFLDWVKTKNNTRFSIPEEFQQQKQPQSILQNVIGEEDFEEAAQQKKQRPKEDSNNSGWVFQEDAKRIQAGQNQEKRLDGWVFQDQLQNVEEPSFSLGRALGAGVKGFGTSFIDTISKAMGGGEGSPIDIVAQQENIADQLAWDQESQDLKQKGLSEEQIEKQIGKRPELTNLESGIDKFTDGSLIARTEGERIFEQAGKTSGDFVATYGLTPGLSSYEKAYEAATKAVTTLPQKQAVNTIAKNLGKELGKEAVTGALFGAGEQYAKEQGLGELDQFLNGAILASSPFLIKKGTQGLMKGVNLGKNVMKAKGQPTGLPEFLAEAKTPQAMADLELSSRDLTGRVAKTSRENLEEFNELTNKVSKPAFEGLEGFSASKIESDIIKTNRDKILDIISQPAKSQKRGWEFIKDHINLSFEGVKDVYSFLYRFVESEGKNIVLHPEQTIITARYIYESLQKSLLNIPEENAVRKPLEQILNLLDSLRNESVTSITVDRLMATKRALNKILEKSDIIPAPIDLLKPLSRSIKQDILTGLEGSNLKKVYEAAENQFTQAQKVFNNEAILKLRKSQNPEEMGNLFLKSSNLERLNESIGPNESVKDFAQRQVVESISKKSKDLAQELARENQEFLSKKANNALEKLIEFKDPKTPLGSNELVRGQVLKDIQNAYTTSSRPDYTLKLMQNKKGYNLVKDSLERSPRGRSMFKSLQRMTIEDMMSSIIGKDKQIDFDKAKDLFQNPFLKNILRDSIGEEGVKFFEKLETYGKNMSENLAAFKQKEPSLFNKYLDKYVDSNLKYLLFGFFPKSAALSLIGSEAIQRGKRLSLFKILENKNARNTLEQLSRKNLPPQVTEKLFKKLGQVSSYLSKEKED